MPLGDKTGPKGEGAETGRVLGKAAGNESGSTKSEGRPYDSRGGGEGNGQFGRKDTTQDPNLERRSDEKEYRVPDATGRHGKGLGPGEGKADGSALEKTINNNIEKLFFLDPENYFFIAKEYLPIYSQNKKNYLNMTDFKNQILRLHNEAVKLCYTGKERRDYVRKKIKNSLNKSSSKTSSSKEEYAAKDKPVKKPVKKAA